MKLFSSIFFLLIMSASIAMSVVEQVYGEEICKVECSADDTDEEKKTEKEKEIYLFEYHPLLKSYRFQEQATQPLFAHIPRFPSEVSVSILEMPPDAAPAADPC